MGKGGMALRQCSPHCPSKSVALALLALFAVLKLWARSLWGFAWKQLWGREGRPGEEPSKDLTSPPFQPSTLTNPQRHRKYLALASKPDGDVGRQTASLRPFPHAPLAPTLPLPMSQRWLSPSAQMWVSTRPGCGEGAGDDPSLFTFFGPLPQPSASYRRSDYSDRPLHAKRETLALPLAWSSTEIWDPGARGPDFYCLEIRVLSPSFPSSTPQRRHFLAPRGHFLLLYPVSRSLCPHAPSFLLPKPQTCPEPSSLRSRPRVPSPTSRPTPLSSQTPSLLSPLTGPPPTPLHTHLPAEVPTFVILPIPSPPHPQHTPPSSALGTRPHPPFPPDRGH